MEGGEKTGSKESCNGLAGDGALLDGITLHTHTHTHTHTHIYIYIYIHQKNIHQNARSTTKVPSVFTLFEGKDLV